MKRINLVFLPTERRKGKIMARANLAHLQSRSSHHHTTKALQKSQIIHAQ
jgi:hypothetical protein